MGITIRGNGLKANTPRRMGKANVLSPEIKNKAVAENVATPELVTVTLNRKQINDLKQLLKIEASELGGRPATDFIARKYEAILKSIGSQS